MLCAWKLTQSMQTYALIIAEPFVLLGLDSGSPIQHVYVILGLDTFSQLKKKKKIKKKENWFNSHNFLSGYHTIIQTKSQNSTEPESPK